MAINLPHRTYDRVINGDRCIYRYFNAKTPNVAHGRHTV